MCTRTRRLRSNSGVILGTTPFVFWDWVSHLVFGAFSRLIWPPIVHLVSSRHPSQGSNTSSHAQLVCLCNMYREIYKVSTQSLVDIRCLPLLPYTVLPWDGVLTEPEAHRCRHAGWAPFPNTGVGPAQRLHELLEIQAPSSMLTQPSTLTCPSSRWVLC